MKHRDNNQTPRGSYILAALRRHCLNGDAYIPVSDAYRICCGDHRVSYEVFHEDLLELGVPYIQLESNHRQAEAGEGLQNNVVEFNRHHSLSDLTFDESFVLHERDEAHVRELLVREAARSYLNGERVQVLSPYNKATELSVDKLNRALQKLVNPARADRTELHNGGCCFRHGDCVMITQNDREKCCVNGDVGVLWINDANEEMPVYHVMLADGRCPGWIGYEGLRHMTLAYALTVHKAHREANMKLSSCRLPTGFPGCCTAT